MTSFSEYASRVAAGEVGQPVDTSVPKEARPYQGHRAGFVTRALASIIDITAVIALVLVLNLGAALVRMIVNHVQGIDLPKLGWSVLLGTVLVWLEWTYAWCTTGRSIGMHVMGLRIVNHAGERVRLPAAALRAAFCVVFPLGLLWSVISPANRSVQDVVLRTSVIYDWVIALPRISDGPSADTTGPAER